MDQRVSLITLGVDDISRARGFYEALGWHGQQVEDTVFFQAGGLAIVLWAGPRLPTMPASPTPPSRAASLGSRWRTTCVTTGGGPAP
jgi:catechol 2,3-dioxygenase-like lactoylglutathione lyase family enzyme